MSRLLGEKKTLRITFEKSWVEFGDCLEGLKKLPDKSIDLCLTDPPYNIKTGQFRGFKYNNRPERIIYEDYRNDYLDWCKEWFFEVSRITKMQLIFCGLKNIQMWYQNFDVRDLLVIYKPFAGYGSRIATFSQYTPVMCLGKFNQELNHNVVIDDRSDYTKDTWIHPHPKNPKVLKKIIEEINPNAVLDPFLGSGTTLQAVLMIKEKNIPCYAFELRDVYRPDIEKRIRKGKKIRNQQNIINFIK